MKFKDYTAWKRLEHCKEKVPDLTRSNSLNEKRIKEMTLSACRLKMFYGTERVDEQIVGYLSELAHEANVLEKMAFLQDMEVMNYVNNYQSEKRRVGHTAIRNLSPKKCSDAAKNASKEYQVELKKLEAFLPKVRDYKSMIAVGIGGSYLGTKAVYEALKAYQKNDRKLYFASNVDPDKLVSILDEVNLASTLVVIISKSGQTLEISAQEEFLRNYFAEAGLDTKNHFVMVTGKGSPMDRPQSYLEVFYMWDFIGGRYSVSSMVGAVPICFMLGMSIWESFLLGLHDMDVHALTEKDPKKNMPLMGALLGIWNRNFLHCDTMAIVPYSQALDSWSLHLQQLFMESNGKSVAQVDGSFIDWDTCPVIWGTVGTEGQHSYYQCIHQGTKVIPMEFIGFVNSQMEHDEVIEGTTNQEKLLANLFAQAIGLATGEHVPNHNKYFPGNRPSHIILAEKLDAYTLGNLLAYHEHYVAFQGFIWGVNSFDQEGVQLGKVLANGIINLFKEKREKGAPSHLKESETARAFLSEMEGLCQSKKRSTHRRTA